MSSKSKFSNSTSKSYALALYEIAKEEAKIEVIETGINGIKKLLDESLDFKEMILNPVVTKEEKKQVIFKIADNYNFNKTLKNFLGFLAMKNRLFFLEQIVESFLNITSSNKGELKVKFFSSKKLTENELEKIQNELSKDFQSSIKIDYKHDPNLIAGLTIQVGSIMVDTSIKSKLIKLEKNMVEA